MVPCHDGASTERPQRRDDGGCRSTLERVRYADSAGLTRAEEASEEVGSKTTNGWPT